MNTIKYISFNLSTSLKSNKFSNFKCGGFFYCPALVWLNIITKMNKEIVCLKSNKCSNLKYGCFSYCPALAYLVGFNCITKMNNRTQTSANELLNGTTSRSRPRNTDAKCLIHCSLNSYTKPKLR